MRRPAVFAAVLLPLPIAALPLVSVVFSHWVDADPEPRALAVRYESAPPASLARDEALGRTPLAYTATESLKEACHSPSPTVGG